MTEPIEMEINLNDVEPAVAHALVGFDLLTGVEWFMYYGKQAEHFGLPEDVYDKLRVLRRRMLADVNEGEVGEYLEAEFANDAVGIADGLLDVMVIAYGTLLTYFGPEVTKKMAAEVTRSNLEKVGSNMVKREDGKIMKPEGWVGPQIAEILLEAGVIKEKEA